MEIWFNRLIAAIDMKALMPARVVYCDEPGNRGLTGVAIIETSHIALHAWDEIEPGLLELDIFSCKDFDVNVVIDALREFDLRGVDFHCIDRTKSLTRQKLWAVYKTTNMINGKSYVGVHSAYNSKTYGSYIGSGVRLGLAVAKYGKENFSHSIIKIFTNANDAYAFERSIVDHEWVADPNTYNLKIGGRYENADAVDAVISAKRRGKSYCVWITNGIESRYVKPEVAERMLAADNSWKPGRTITQAHKMAQSAGHLGKPSWRKGLTGIISDETKALTSKSMKAKFDNGYQVHNKGKKKGDNG